MSSNKKSVKKEPVKPKHADIDEEFLDEGSEKKAIIIIMLGILIIIGLIMVLLVIFDKDDVKDNPDDVKKPTIVEPDKKDDDNPAQIETETEKVASSDTTEVEETVFYRVIFIYGNDRQIERSVEKGSTVVELAIESLPKGYRYLGYYKDDGYKDLFDFNEGITSNTYIYIKTELIIYTIKDASDMSVLYEYNVEKNDYVLPSKASTANSVFEGWYLEDNFLTKITKISEDIIEDDEIILLYPKFVDKFTVSFESNDGDVSGSVSQIVYTGDSSSITLPSSGFTHSDGYRLLGWSTSPSADTIQYALGETFTPTSDLVLYPAFGTYIVEVNTNSETEVEDIIYKDGEGFNFPDENTLVPPKYYEKDDGSTVGSLLVVRKDNPEDVLPPDQIDIEIVKQNKGSSYTEEVEEGHYVVEKEKVFDGWTETVEDTSPDAEPGDTVEEPIDPSTWEPTSDTEINAVWEEAP